jgi:hypothetical protein
MSEHFDERVDAEAIDLTAHEIAPYLYTAQGSEETSRGCLENSRDLFPDEPLTRASFPVG